MEKMKGTYSTYDIMRMFDVSQSCVSAWCKSGKIPQTAIVVAGAGGGQMARFDKAKIDSMVTDGTLAKGRPVRKKTMKTAASKKITKTVAPRSNGTSGILSVSSWLNIVPLVADILALPKNEQKAAMTLLNAAISGR